MKRVLSVIIVLSLLFIAIVDTATADSYAVFTGIHWGDSLEFVQTFLGKGKVTKYSDSWCALNYSNSKFGNDKASYSLYFSDDKLYQINVDVFNFDDPDTNSKIYLDVFTQEYGAPIKTSFESAISGSIEEDPDSNTYYWKVDETTKVYMTLGSGVISISYHEIKEDTEDLSASTAEEKQELLFRGVPWGINLPSAIEQISDITFGKPSGDYAVSTSNRCLDKGDSWGFGLGVYVESQKTINVAGYSASVALGFAYTPNTEGLLPKTEADTALTYATYYIRHKDARFAVEDLSEKLTKLYGEPKRIQKDVVIEYDIYYWEGANNTIISLIGEFFDSGTTHVSIVYSFYGADDLYNAAKEAIDLEERLTTDKEDHSGL